MDWTWVAPITSILAAVIALVSVNRANKTIKITKRYNRKTIKMNDRHNRLSVKPHLTVSYYKVPPSNYSVSVINTGIGPAIIKSQKVYLDDKCVETPGSYDGGLIHFVNTAIGPNTCNVVIMGFDYGVLPGQVINIVKLKENYISDDLVEKFKNGISKFRIEIEYRSMYEDELLKPLIWSASPEMDDAQNSSDPI